MGAAIDMAGIHSTEGRPKTIPPQTTPNPWTCTFCNETMSGAHRVRHIIDEHADG